MDTKKYTIIVASGSGSRMHSAIPKQFLLIDGKPILMHTIQKFFDYCKNMRIIVAISAEYINSWQSLCYEYNFGLPHLVATGGASRFQSVKNSLALIDTDGLVAIHDGVRPFVSMQTIDRCFTHAAARSCAIPTVHVVDSVRQIIENNNVAIDRENLRLVQTPQVFDIKKLKAAYEIEYSHEFTDDATVYERAGNKIHLTEGNIENIKITTPHDLYKAQSYS